MFKSTNGFETVDVLLSLKGEDSCKDNCKNSYLSGGFLIH